MNCKYLILGAGPSGLTLANALIQAGVGLSEIVILEKESEVGGLCRSEVVDNAPLDIGGGHFLDVKNQVVLNFLFQFLPRTEWHRFKRIAKIRLHGMEIDHPLEANLWQLPLEMQVHYLDAITNAGCLKGKPMPDSFEEWIEWKFGEAIANDYMLPYNKKIWSIDCRALGTYWLYKLPDVSFKEILRSCLEKKPSGKLPAHGEFFYPKKYGYGEIWRRMGKRLRPALITNCPVEQIDIGSKTVNGKWKAETIVNTIPWPLWSQLSELPADIKNAIDGLEWTSIDVDYFQDIKDSPSHWIYEPLENISYHRLLLRSNFVPGSRGYWTETNTKRSTRNDRIRFRNEFAYPINTLEKPQFISTILNWSQSLGIYGIGRWGKWEHMNSDTAVAEALLFSEKLLEA